MKYGLLIHKQTKNIGDDIQSFASSLFLPRIDYIVDRDYISEFQSKKNEPVAVIMSAWWLWKKWNWPPSECIIPKLIGMHYTDFGIRTWGSPIYYENLQGVGGDYLKSYGPVGCRDMHTLNLFQSLGVDSYFSGCITLTLPKMKKIKPKRKYICIVDVDDRVKKKILEMAKDKDVDVKILTHQLDEKNQHLNWKERSKNVQELLTTYQNATCVITGRLHAALPCLALEVPVLCVYYDLECNRFDPYKTYFTSILPHEFLEGSYDYDVFNPKPNSKTYLKVRKTLIKEINEFIKEMKKNSKKTLEELIKTKYSYIEKLEWQNQLMKKTLEKWFYQNRELLDDHNHLVWENNLLKKQLEQLNNKLTLKKVIKKILYILRLKK